MELDRYDRQILQVLQEDGRISNQELADRIGLSPSPCLRRVRALGGGDGLGALRHASQQKIQKHPRLHRQMRAVRVVRVKAREA